VNPGQSSQTIAALDFDVLLTGQAAEKVRSFP